MFWEKIRLESTGAAVMKEIIRQVPHLTLLCYSVYVQSTFSLCSVYVQCESFALTLTLRDHSAGPLRRRRRPQARHCTSKRCVSVNPS